MKEPIDDWAPIPERYCAKLGWRPLRYALLGAVQAMTVAVLLSALQGFLFGLTSAFYGSHEPGWDAAVKLSTIMLFMGVIPVGGTGFVIGMVIGLLKGDETRRA